MFVITKWTKCVTDERVDKTVAKKPKNLNHKFRLLDDDGLVYVYGYSSSCDDEEAFAPLDHYEGMYGVTEIQYKSLKTGKYETL